MSANPLSSIPPIGPTTGISPRPSNGRFKPIDPLRVLRQYAVVLILAAIVGVALGVGVYFALRTWDPIYTSYLGYKVESRSPSAWGGLNDNSTAGSTTAVQMAINDQINLLLSENVLKYVVNRTAVQNTTWYQHIKQQAGDSKNPLEEAQKDLQNHVISASPIPDSSMFKVSVGTHDKNDAGIIAEALKEVYQQQLSIQANENGSNLISAFVTARDNDQTQVTKLEKQLQNFTTQHQISTVQSERSDASINYQNLADQQSKLNMQLVQAKTQYQSLEQQLKTGNLQPTPTDLATVEQMPAVQNLKQQIRDMKQQRQVLLERFGENHPAVRQMDRKIDTAEAQLKDLRQSLLQQRQSVEISQAAQTVESIKQQLAKLAPSLKSASAQMTDLKNQLNQYAQIQGNLDDARQQLQTATVALNDAQMRQKRPDYVPVSATSGPTTAQLTSPRIKVVVPGVTILVLGLVTGLVFLKEVMDQRVKSPADVNLLASAELLGVVPDAAEDPSGSTAVERVVELQPTGLLSESFRQVRTAVLSKMDRRGYKTLVVAGAQPECGASAIASNLAASLAYNGRRVLLVDANFRRPGQHALRGVSNDRGLAEVLRGQATAADVLVRVEGLTMAIMPTGHGADVQPEVLEGQPFRSLISELERQFDLIVIDAPPALLTSECRLLAKQVDALALVARAGRDKRGMIDRMHRQLDGQRADILGVILNGVRSSAGGYFRKNYQDFYRYQHKAGANGDGRSAAVPQPSETSESRP